MRAAPRGEGDGGRGGGGGRGELGRVKLQLGEQAQLKSHLAYLCPNKSALIIVCSQGFDKLSGVISIAINLTRATETNNWDLRICMEHVNLKCGIIKGEVP